MGQEIEDFLLAVSSTSKSVKKVPVLLAKFNGSQLRFPVALPTFLSRFLPGGCSLPKFCHGACPGNLGELSQKVSIKGHVEPKSQHHRANQTKWQMYVGREVGASGQVTRYNIHAPLLVLCSHTINLWPNPSLAGRSACSRSYRVGNSAECSANVR